jgi:hypothetical protein
MSDLFSCTTKLDEATCFIRLLFRITGIARVDGVIYPTDLIFSSGHLCVVNTKNWYREGTKLWAEFGRRAPFGKRFSSKHSVKTPAVGSTSSFGRRAVSRLEEEAFGNA